jgi:hypothetical protein
VPCDEDKVVEALVIVISAGFQVDVFTLLCVRPLEDGRFAVTYHPETNAGPEEVFDDARAAVTRFIELRHERRLGLDYETVADGLEDPGDGK